MVSLDEYHYEVPNMGILRNVVEGHANDYPQYQAHTSNPRQWLLLAELCLTNCLLVGTDDEGRSSYCVFDIGEDPHVQGKVLVMQMTLSCSSKAMRAITKRLLDIAYQTGCSYIWISKRTGDYSYAGTFYKLRRKP